MKILFICESYPTSASADLTGGVETGDYYLSSELAKDHIVSIITANRIGAPSRQRLNNVHIYRVGIPVTHSQRENIFVRLIFMIAAIFKSFQLSFDVVRGSNVFTNVITSTIGIIRQKKSVATIPDIYSDSWINNKGLIGIIYQFIEKIMLIMPYHHYVVWTQTVKDKLIKQGIKTSLISIIGGGVVDFKGKVTKYPAPTIIFAGRLLSYKHVDILITAFAEIKKNIPDALLLIIGEGEQKTSLQRLVDLLKLNHCIKFLGFLNKHQDVLKYIKKSHLLCNPSSVEGFGLITIESVSLKVPYINSDIPVTREITHNGQGGLLFKLNNPHDLAKNVVELLTNKNLYRQKIKEGVQLASFYKWSNVSKAYAEVFN